MTEQRLYWMNYYGDIKSANVDGSDVRTIFRTISITDNYYRLGVSGCNIYSNYNNQLIMRKKSLGSTATVLFDDTVTIRSIYAFNSTCMLKPLNRDFQ